MKKRFETGRFYGEFFILPSVGVIFRHNTTFAPRIAVAWFCWGCSFGFGKKEVDE